MKQISIKKLVTVSFSTVLIMAFSFCAQAEFINDKNTGWPSEGGYWYSHYEQNKDDDAWMSTNDYSESKVNFTVDANNVVSGRGWKTGKRNRTIHFGISDYQPWWWDQKIVFAAYGWTRQNPAANNHHRNIVEYYVIENNNGWKPEHQGTDGNGATEINAKWVDGEWYKYYVSTRENQPHAYERWEGDVTTFKQYWAVRQSSRNSGSINMKKHFDHWNNPWWAQRNNKYPYTNQWGYQIFMVESYQVGGSVKLNSWSQ